MRDDPIWLLMDTILVVHEISLQQHGGSAGLRDRAMLESAAARARHQFAYGDSDICDLAACYAFGIANNHPFIDGNKRTAFMAAYTFLGDNGLELTAPEADAAVMTLGLADKSVTEESYAQWLRDNTKPQA
ncbi:type II toxin-antitoxin system death-on-curing family toxin [soil metagenome]